MSNQQAQLLQAKEDHYDGLSIDPESLPADPESFGRDLQYSIETWSARGKRGIWLNIPLERAALLHIATKAGFDFHHAQPGYVMLTRWLPSEVSTLPENLLYNVGVGAFLMNDRNEVLLVQEANGILRGKGIWKFPTGLANPGEDIHEAAEREVLEETGIRAKFDALLAIRQSHGLFMGKSDLFFVCALRLEPGDQQLVVQESELAAAAWHPIEEVAAMPIFQTGTFKTVFDACMAYARQEYSAFTAAKMPNGFNSRLDFVMHGLQ